MPEAANYRRPPDVVMRLARMGSFHQTRLSFMRTLLRRVKREGWRFKVNRFELDDDGFGRAVYTVYAPGHAYSLVAFSHYLPDDMRSDRVIATAWDATFTLFDGIPTEEDLDRLEQNVPKQEAGRISDSELSLSRMNKSVRLWQHVVESLAAGQQPDWDKLEAEKMHRWVFQPTGMVRPMRIRFQSAGATFEIHFDPLTGEIQRERSYVR